MTINRRHCLLALGASAALPAFADAPALKRPLAAQGLTLDLCRAGQRLAAVGERGHVLLSDDQGKSWRQAAEVPTRTTLTCVHATDARRLWAAGHGGIILRSDDAGEHWSLVTGKIEGGDVLMSIRVEADGRGLAVGGFGYALRTQDGGAHWARATLLEGEDGERHLNRIFVSAAGTWLIAAENGAILRSEGGGAQPWSLVAAPYKGSLWNGLALSRGPPAGLRHARQPAAQQRRRPQLAAHRDPAIRFADGHRAAGRSAAGAGRRRRQPAQR